MTMMRIKQPKILPEDTKCELDIVVCCTYFIVCIILFFHPLSPFYLVLFGSLFISLYSILTLCFISYTQLERTAELSC